MEKDKLVFKDNRIIIEEVNTKNGERFFRQYEKGKFLGKGGFAKCIELVQTDTRKVFAAKVISKASLQKSRSKRKLMSEIKIHKHLKNENIVNFEHFFEDSENVYILLELCENQTLNELLRRRKRLTELEIKCYLLQMLNALIFIHANRVIHRDLKLSNLFLSSSMEIKVGDFGLATKLSTEGEHRKTVCGTPNYIAPEILDSKCGHSYEVDVWSLGVIIYTLLIGKPPFETSDVNTTYRKIKMNDYSFPENIKISKEVRNLIEKIFVLNPAQRLTLKEIYEHEFLSPKSAIPKVLPSSTLACPPSVSYLKRLEPNKDLSVEIESQNKKMLVENTEPLIKFEKKGKSEMRMTDRRVSESINVGLGKNKKGILTCRNNKYVDEKLNKEFFIMDEKREEQLKTEGIEEEMEEAKTGRQIGSDKPKKNENQVKTEEVFVVKYLHEPRYGLGYLLSNGNYGAYFNDSSKIFSRFNSNIVYYIETGQKIQKDPIKTYNIDECPQELSKKVKILTMFKNYLELTNEEKIKEMKEKNSGLNSVEDENAANVKGSLIFLKRWKKTEECFLFFLNNKSIQAIFNDQVQILASSANLLIYTSANGEQSVFPLRVCLNVTNAEIKKKLRFVIALLKKELAKWKERNENENEKDQKKKKANENLIPKDKGS